MKTFTIDNATNTIAAHPTLKEAATVPDAEQFNSPAALTKLAADWTSARLIEIWNHLPGVTTVRKFKDRNTAISRIWKAVQNLEQLPPAPATEPVPVTETAAALDRIAEVDASFPLEEAPCAAPKQTPGKKEATREKNTSTAKSRTTGARTGSKKEAILALMKRKGGTTLGEIMHATGWQAHSVRGFISGTLGKKMSLAVISAKSADGQRRYSIKG